MQSQDVTAPANSKRHEQLPCRPLGIPLQRLAARTARWLGAALISGAENACRGVECRLDNERILTRSWFVLTMFRCVGVAPVLRTPPMRPVPSMNDTCSQPSEGIMIPYDIDGSNWRYCEKHMQ